MIVNADAAYEGSNKVQGVAPRLGRILRLAPDWALGPSPMLPTRLPDLALYLALALVGSALALSRIPSDGLRTLWAEDASIFFTDAYSGSWWAIVLEPYAGYAHLFPRSVAAFIAAWVPFEQIPVATAVVACLVASVTGCIVVWALRAKIPSLPLRLVLFVSIVLMPAAGGEVNGSIANSHWYLLVAAFAVLSSRQRGVVGNTFAGLVVFVAIVSDPLGVLFAPLAALRLLDLGRAGWTAWLVPASFVAGAVIQVVVVSGTELGGSRDSFSIGGLGRALAFRVYLQSLVGQAGAIVVFEAVGYAALVAGVFCVLAVCGLMARSRVGGTVLPAVALATVFFLVCVALRWFSGFDPNVPQYDYANRYSIVPISLMSIALVAAASVIPSWLPRKATRVAVTASLAIAVAVGTSILLDWGVSGRSGSPNWDQEVERALQECRSGSTPESVTISGQPANFTLTMQCSVLERVTENPWTTERD